MTDVPAEIIAARAPLAHGWPLIGLSVQMRNDPLGTMDRVFAKYGGDAVYFKLGWFKATLIRHPTLLKHVFVDKPQNFTKQTRGYQKARLVLGEGLVTSEGELWQRQRRIATPAFHRQRVAGFAQTMVDATQQMMIEWQPSAAAGRPVDVFDEMMRVTLHIAVQTLLGVGPSDELERVSDAVSEVLERTNDIITNPLSLPLWMPLPKYTRFKRALKVLDDFVYATIAARRKDATEAHDLLSMLLAARDEETGLGMSDRQLRDEAVTILIAGHETTANVLSWAMHLLGQHPEMQQQLRDEVTGVLHGAAPTVADIGRLPLTRAIIDETMRLYPPAWMLGRAVMNDDTVGRYHVRRGEFLLISPYVTHRHPDLWDKPTEFDPQRFLDGRSERLPKFAFIPFGGGQRFCIGSNFASMQAVLMLSSIVQTFRWSPVAGDVVKPYAMITLRPRVGIRMILQSVKT